MNKEKAMEWVAALRSGEFKQGRHYLHLNFSEGARYCCLGVACIIAGTRAEPDGGVIRYGEMGERICEGHLPLSAKAELGMFHTMAMPRKGDVEIGGKSYQNLARANDAGVGFDEIADWIEENYENL